MTTGRAAVLLGVLLILIRLAAAAPAFADEPAKTTWLDVEDSAMPGMMAKAKDPGIHSNWTITDEDERMWDFAIGMAMTMWRREEPNRHQTIAGKWMVASRFQFDSPSFDLWAADYRGGVAWAMVPASSREYEVYLFHESSHLGDEIQERDERDRIDFNINGVRILTARHWPRGLRTYAGLTWLILCDPAELESVGVHLGAELIALPPWKRGFMAVDAECWEWRDGNPDVTCQVGMFLGPRKDGFPKRAQRMYMEVYSGRVRFGQFYDETESCLSLGLALSL